MSYKAIEAQVKKQSALLAKAVQRLSASSPHLIGKFMAYFEGNTVVGNTHEQCFCEAEKKFGNNGFAIAEIAPKKHLLVSALIKLK